MMIKQTAVEMPWGTLPPNLRSSMTMCCSARYGVEKTGFPFEIAA